MSRRSNRNLDGEYWDLRESKYEEELLRVKAELAFEKQRVKRLIELTEKLFDINKQVSQVYFTKIKCLLIVLAVIIVKHMIALL